MDFELNGVQKQFLDKARKFALNEIRPVAAELDSGEIFSVDLVKKAAQLGFLGMDILNVNRLDNYAIIYNVEYRSVLKSKKLEDIL